MQTPGGRRALGIRAAYAAASDPEDFFEMGSKYGVENVNKMASGEKARSRRIARCVWRPAPDACAGAQDGGGKWNKFVDMVFEAPNEGPLVRLLSLGVGVGDAIQARAREHIMYICASRLTIIFVRPSRGGTPR